MLQIKRKELLLQGVYVTNKFIEENLDLTTDKIYELMLINDLRQIGTDTGISDQMRGKTCGVLRGPYVLQINDFLDISAKGEDREIVRTRDDKGKRTLKLVLSDGIHRSYGIEKTNLRSFTELTQPGAKILIKNVPFNRGYLLLKDENAIVLGGYVQELIDLKQKKIREIQKRKW